MNLISNNFVDGMNKVVDAMWLSILWFLCSIPIFTIGASTTALYYTMLKVIQNDRGHVASEFFSCFRKNFKQATITWLILFGLYLFFGYDYLVMKQAVSLGEKTGYIYYVFLVLLLLLTLWGVYIFPYIARFQNTVKETLYNTAYIAVANIHWTLLLGLLFFVAWALIYMYPPVAIFIPSMYHFFKTRITERVFLKYMSLEDIEAEKERNQIYH